VHETLTYASETGTLTEGDRKQLNIFERKVYGRISGPVYGNEKENWRILTDKEIYASVKKPTVIETVRLNSVDKKNQPDVTFCILYFSSNSCSTCFGQPCARHQELTTA